jgi:hypothetical protein
MSTSFARSSGNLPERFSFQSEFEAFIPYALQKSKNPLPDILSDGGFESGRFDYRAVNRLPHTPELPPYNSTWPRRVGGCFSLPNYQRKPSCPRSQPGFET